MRAFRRAALLSIAGAIVLGAPLAFGQSPPVRRRIPTPSPTAFTRLDPMPSPTQEESRPIESRALRGRFGLDVAERLARGSNRADRLRAIARARSLGTAEATGFLIEQASRVSQGDGDGAIAIEVVRALDSFADNERVRSALDGLVTMSSRASSHEASNLEDPEDLAQRDRARSMAALSLARTHEPSAQKKLVDVLRTAGPGTHAAKIALWAYPPSASPFEKTPSALSIHALEYVVKSGDLRALSSIHAMLESEETAPRAAALRALADLGDSRAISAARPLLDDTSPDLRAAATYVLVRLGTPDAEKSLIAAMQSPATIALAIEMSEHVQTDAVVQQLASIALRAPNAETAQLATIALSRQRRDLAPGILLTLATSEGTPVEYEAVHALGRSASPLGTAALHTLANTPPKHPRAAILRRLAARAYLVRSLTRRERSEPLEAALAQMRESKDALDRAVAAEARIALGIEDPSAALASKEVAVRRAAVMGLAANPDAAARTLLANKLVTDEDATVRVLATVSLLADDDTAQKVPSTWLADRATSGGADAPLATLAFTRRADEKDGAKVNAFLASRETVIRAHAARGLGASSVKASVGKLAQLYAYEPEPSVRRAAIEALSVRSERTSPLWISTMQEASVLDPDAQIRWLATATLENRVLGAPPTREALFLRATNPGTAAQPLTGAVVRADGLAFPFVFDGDGYAVIPGVPPGEGRVQLTPSLP